MKKYIVPIIVFVLLGTFVGVAVSQAVVTNLQPGTYDFFCETGRLRHNNLNNNPSLVRLICSAAIPTPTNTPFPTATNTPIPLPTLTPTPLPLPTNTPSPSTGLFDCNIPASQRNFVCQNEIAQKPNPVPNLNGQICPAWVHDKYLVSAFQNTNGLWLTLTNAENVMWRTWHPQFDPETGCAFNHEHGANPAESLADNSYPAFGLLGCLHEISHNGMAMGGHCLEPHEGFKVFVAPQGFVNDEGRVFNYNSRIVAHFGTSREGRFTQPSHSFQQSIRSNDGTVYAYFAGMFESNLSGNICQRDASLANGNPADNIGRTLYENPAISTCTNNSPYEIWNSEFNVVSPTQGDPNENFRVMKIGNSVAAFDTATFYTENNGVKTATQTGMFGCDRESYHESPFWYTRDWGINSVYTDMHGNEIPLGTPGGNLQYWSTPRNTNGGVGYGQLSMTNDNSTVMKRHEPTYCNQFIQFPN